MLSWLQTHVNRLSLGHVSPPAPASDASPMNVLLVQCHPQKGSFSSGLATAAREGLERAGHTVDTVSLYDMDGKGTPFQPLLTAEEHKSYFDVDPAYPTPATDVAPLVEKLARADALVLCYPTWWFNVPAILKGFLDRCLMPGRAFRLPHLEPHLASELRPRDLGLVPNLPNIKKVAVITTYGAPQHVTFLAGDCGRTMIGRSLLALCADDCTLTWLGLYDMDKTSPESRTTFLGEVRSRLEKL